MNFEIYKTNYLVSGDTKNFYPAPQFDEVIKVKDLRAFLMNKQASGKQWIGIIEFLAKLKVGK